MTDRKKLQTWILLGVLIIFMLTACQDSAEPDDKDLLTEGMILSALEDRNIKIDESEAQLTIQIYPTIWEALQEHRQEQKLGENFSYRKSENQFRYWVKNAVIILDYDEVDMDQYIQTLTPIRETIFEDLNPLQEVVLAGESENWSAKAPVRYYAYHYEDEEGDEQLAAYYELEIELTYLRSVEGAFHDLELKYETAQQEGHRLSAMEGVIGTAEEVVGEDGRINLAGFKRAGSEHPLHSDHTLYLTDFFGEKIEIPLQP